MNLHEFKFPTVSAADVAFPTFDTIPELLKEAEERGFMRSENKYNRLFSKIFFRGADEKDILKYKTVPKEFEAAAWKYFNALARSYAPKHEHKEAVCAMLLSELVEIPDV